MYWDEALLRKFSSTGHYRLLNQLRSELRAHPLSRNPESKKLTLEVKPFKASSVRTMKRPNALESKEQQEGLAEKLHEETPKSFRERLNAIEMR